MSDHATDIALSAKLNASRLRCTLAQLGPEKAALLSWLPWLLHSNQPGQPGFVYGAPFGFVKPPLTTATQPCIGAETGPLLGLYTMGSSGSVGQNPESDFDCWLVYPDGFNEPTLQALERKCQRLSEFYLEHGIELHLFLLSPDWLSCGQRGKFSKEHSGSAQSWLLLEECYRSQIHLAGKPLAWWPHAPQDHPELLSLGELRHLPAAEIFGGVLWHLFKGLDRPHKALLKILLLESYVADYPDLRILRDEMWVRLKAGQALPELDHYRMMYQRIEAYLLRLGDKRRLTLVQRCFYLKCGLALSDPLSQQDWRYAYLRDCTSQWRYTRQLLQHLDHARHWHAGQLHWFNERLDHSMLASYQRLAHMANHLSLPKQLRLEELTVLTRKLAAQFESNPNKIPKLNRLWSDDLREPSLTLVAVQTNPELAPGWYLYRQPPQGQQLFGESPLYQNPSRLNCVLWAAANGLIGPDCQISCHKDNQFWFSKRLSDIGQRLAQLQPSVETRFTDLGQPWHYRSAVVVANLDLDPTKLHPQASQWRHHRHRNPLSLGQPAKSMVGDLHLITYNSWGERHCFSYRGDEAPLQLLNQLFSGISHNLNVEVICCAKHQCRNIKTALTELIRTAQIQRQLPTESPWFIDIGADRYGIVVAKRQLRWHRFDEAPQLLKSLQRRQISEQTVPSAIRAHARSGLLQVFVEENSEQVLLHLLDGDNQLQSKPIAKGELNSAIDALSVQFSTPMRANEHNPGRPGFDLPQFYRLRQDEQRHWQVTPLER
ncbi:class I adenylate cyclase [uncultured Ferrimonas sp.]|uniref:class I adenylate cyclase n=1 Tax=uncultured Ferrimonas sp. TaxID=432640 RepID=UPI00263418A4|nr:class I adenylate cyclase [uncultured Ferrimonas sp.]